MFSATVTRCLSDPVSFSSLIFLLSLSCSSYPPHMQAYLYVCVTTLFFPSHVLSVSGFVPCLTPQFDLQVFCKMSHWLLKYSANTSMCYCSLPLCETAGIFHRSGLSIKLLSPDRLCWWISLRLPRVKELFSGAALPVCCLQVVQLPLRTFIPQLSFRSKIYMANLKKCQNLAVPFAFQCFLGTFLTTWIKI